MLLARTVGRSRKRGGRFTLVIMMVMSLCGPVLASSLPCESILLTPTQAREAYNRAFREQLEASPGLRRLYVRLKQSFLRNEALRTCAERGGCTEQQLADAARQAVIESRIPNAFGYGFLVGGMMINAAVTSGLMKLLNHETHFGATFTGAFVGQMSFISVSLLAPFLDPIASRIRRLTFALTNGGGQAPESNGTSEALEAQLNHTNSIYSARAQYAQDRMFVLRNAIRLNFDHVHRFLETGERELVVAELADALMIGYRHFRDINPADHTIVHAVRTVFLRRPDEMRALYEPVLAYIRDHEPLYSESPRREGEISPARYYELALRAWLVDGVPGG